MFVSILFFAEDDISMCGVLPVSVLISAMKAMGVAEAKLIDYHTSGDVFGEYGDADAY